MTKNVGGVDRVLRLVVGTGLIVWGLMTQNLWGAIGLVPLATAAIAWCPAYAPFGIKTTKA